MTVYRANRRTEEGVTSSSDNQGRRRIESEEDIE